MQLLFSNNDQEWSDKTLISSWQAGDDSAFDMLYKRYVINLVKLLTQKTGSFEIAKELAQDVFLAVYLQKETLHEIENFKAFLFSIAKFKVFNHYRHEMVRQNYYRRLLMNETEPILHHDTELENKELVQLVHRKIEELPTRCREVFKLSREENLTYQAIAKRLKISENTVDQHIQKALRKIRDVIKDYHKQDDKR